MDKKPMNENDLILSLKRGNESALKEIYSNYFFQLYNYSKKYIKSPQLSEEIVQDVFLKLWEKKHDLREEVSSLKPFLHTICKNNIINTLRRAVKEQSIQADILEHYFLEFENPENELIFKEYKEIALKAIAELPPKRQVVYKMCRLEGKTYEEVATLLNISKGTINDHIIKAHKYVKDFMIAKAGISLLLTLITSFL